MVRLALRCVGAIPPVYIFPIAIVMTVGILSSLQISGTSMGVYDYMFGKPGSNLIIGEPRTVRSDEWTVTTPFTIAQSENNFSIFNRDIGTGQDMSVVVDVPYIDWSILFRPQNIAFLFLPLTIAFAFKWWFMSAILAFGVYVFVLYLYPKRYLAASLLAIFFVLNPFIQWWYQAITILPIAYGLLIIIVTLRLVETNKIKLSLLYSVVLAYLLICFALIMYPAFQISIAIVAGVLFFTILAAKDQLRLLALKRNIVALGIIAAVTVLVVGIFIYQHLEVVKSILSTVYPGSRSIESGGFNPLKLLTWPLSYLLLDSQTAGVFNNNQSEISNFMLFGFVLLPVLFLIWHRQKNTLSKLETYILVALSVTSLLIFCRMFIPIGDELFKLVGLGSVPHVRLFIALGIVNLVVLTVAILRSGKKLSSLDAVLDRWHLVAICTSLLIYGLLISFLVHHFVITTIGIFEGAAVVFSLSLITTLLLSPFTQLRYVGLMGLILFSAVSSVLANPIYKGLSLNTNSLTAFIRQQEAKDNGYWISNDQPYLSSLILSSGAEIQGGVNTYPQLSLWNKYFPNQQDIFNRYAHIRFKIDQTQQHASLSLIQGDSFRVTTPSCDPLLKKLAVKYIVSDTNLGDNLPCYPLKITKRVDQKVIYIYSY